MNVASGVVECVVNGRPERVSGVDDRELLVDMVRHRLRLTGTHVGCEHGVCGACTMLVDGEPVRSCLMLARQVDGCRIETVESLGRGTGQLSPLQESFVKYHALQCGYCTPGILMAVTWLLSNKPRATEADIRAVLSGHICRCTGYQQILQAVRSCAKEASQCLAD